jgi:hypothetical protein
MADVTLKVPADHTERFRDALRLGIHFAGDSLQSEKVPEQIRHDVQRLTTCVRVLDEIGWEGSLGELIVTMADDDAHAFAEEWIMATCEEIGEAGEALNTDAARAKLNWIDLLRGWLGRPTGEAVAVASD